MARRTMTENWSVVMTADQWATLRDHLFRVGGGEHGAILRCGIARGPRGGRLLVRDVVPAIDGDSYIAGDRSHRKLTAEFVADSIDACADEKLAYLAVHNHGGTDGVAFSRADMASHERGYPALLAINDGAPVGALVFARNAVAGDIWTSDGRLHEITHLRVAGRPQLRLTAQPTRISTVDAAYERQTRIFGDRGQALLGASRVAVVGLGGIGSLISQYLARLGVGELLLIDPDRLEPSNLSRVVGARRTDAMTLLRHPRAPGWLDDIGARMATPKVKIAARVARQASKSTRITTRFADATEPEVARLLTDVDHIFIAADSALARRLVNSITHQYLIPHTQVGAKVNADKYGVITDIFSVSRYSTPGSGCLRCAGLIPASRLQEEATTPAQRARQKYVEDDDVHAPSVITLNAVAAARAVDDWLMALGGLIDPPAAGDHWVSYHPMTDEVIEYATSRDAGCVHCGAGRFALGDAVTLLARTTL